MIDEIGRGNRTESRVRIGRWKETVSSVQSARKKRYCSNIGWEARKLGDGEAESKTVWEVFRAEVVVLVRLFGLGGNGGGGESGSAGEDGVAFSIRAHVR